MKKINMGKIPVPMKTVHHASRNIQRGKDAIKEGNTAAHRPTQRQETREIGANTATATPSPWE